MSFLSEVWNGEEWMMLEPNAEEGTKIEGCDWFDGSVLLVVKDIENPQGRYQKTIFGGGRRRMFEVQVQGKIDFDQIDHSGLWVGGELEADRMKLSGLARFAARAALTFVRAAAGSGSTLSYSFGNPQIQEAPHITAPLFSSMPTVGYDCGILGETTHDIESSEDRILRKSSALQAQQRAENVQFFTLALNSAIVDAKNWTAKLPGLPPLDLHRLWEDHKLILAFYALTDTNKDNDQARKFVKEIRHTYKNKRYFLKLRLSHTSTPSTYNIQDDDRTTSKEEETTQALEDKEDDIFYDALSWSDSFVTANSPHSPMPPKAPPPANRLPIQISCGSIFSRGPKLWWRGGSSLISKAVMAQIEPHARCFGWVSVVDANRGRRDYYIIVETDSGKTHLRRRQGKSIASVEDASIWIETASTRLSLAEKRRRRFDATLAGLSQLDDPKTKIHLWLGAKSSADDNFLSKNIQRGFVATLFEIPALCSGLVARASSTRCWREEYAILSPDATLTCYDEKAQPTYAVSISDHRDFLGVSAIAKVNTYNKNRRRTSAFERCQKFAALEIHCLDRILRLVFCSITERDRWLEAIIDCAAANRRQSSAIFNQNLSPDNETRICNDRQITIHSDDSIDSSPGETNYQISDLRQVLAAPGNEWKPAGRWVLNARTLFDDSASNFSSKVEIDDMIALAKNLVMIGYALLADDDDTEKYLAFVDNADRLRNCEPKLLDENARIVFWLNVYHALLAHAALLYGVPKKPSDFCRHFSSLCYEIDGDVTSLAEIEHHILLQRDKQSIIKPYLSDLLSLRPRFNDISLLRATVSDLNATPYTSAINSSDIRLFFALNPGSLSTPSTVQLYTVENLHTQLDAAISLALSTVSLSSLRVIGTGGMRMTDKKILYLPRLCAWRRLSLGDIFRFLDPALRSRLLDDVLVAPRPADSSLVASPDLTIRFLPYSFSCRILELI